MKNAKWMLAVTILLTSGLLMGQALHQTVVAKVPFEFMVGSKVIPAGDCVIQTDDSNIVMVHNVDAKASALSATLRADANQADRTTLKFERRGGEYFLVEVSVQGSSETYRLPESRNEAEMRAQNAPASTVTLLASLK